MTSFHLSKPSHSFAISALIVGLESGTTTTSSSVALGNYSTSLRFHLLICKVECREHFS